MADDISSKIALVAVTGARGVMAWQQHQRQINQYVYESSGKLAAAASWRALRCADLQR